MKWLTRIHWSVRPSGTTKDGNSRKYVVSNSKEEACCDVEREFAKPAARFAAAGALVPGVAGASGETAGHAIGCQNGR